MFFLKREQVVQQYMYTRVGQWDNTINCQWRSEGGAGTERADRPGRQSQEGGKKMVT